MAIELLDNQDLFVKFLPELAEKRGLKPTEEADDLVMNQDLERILK